MSPRVIVLIVFSSGWYESEGGSSFRDPTLLRNSLSVSMERRIVDPGFRVVWSTMPPGVECVGVENEGGDAFSFRMALHVC